MTSETKTVWHRFPDEKPPHEGAYLVIADPGCGPNIAVFTWKDENFSGGFLCELASIVEYWAELPQMPETDPYTPPAN